MRRNRSGGYRRNGDYDHGYQRLDLHRLFLSDAPHQAWPANLFSVMSAVVRFFSRSCFSPQPHSHETPPV